MIIFSENQGWLTITFNRPDKANAINLAMFNMLTTAFNKNPAGIIFKANGNHFCAGADLLEMQQLKPSSVASYTEDIAHCLQTLAQLKCPIIVECFGYTGGAGIGICAIADIVVADQSASFACPEIKSNIAPAIIAPYLINKIGISQTNFWFITGKTFTAQNALRAGLVHDIAKSATEYINLVQQNTMASAIKQMSQQEKFGAKVLAEFILAR